MATSDAASLMQQSILIDRSIQTTRDHSTHSLLMTAALLAISAGATVLAAQRMLGHASAAMTLDVYSDLFDDDLDAVADALDARARTTARGAKWPVVT